METKICEICYVELPLSQFWKRGGIFKGHDQFCIECRLELSKNKRKSLGNYEFEYIKIHRPKTEDYCGMWDLLSKLGYDVNSDISIQEQFCLKYGLKKKKKGRTHHIPISPNQCKKNPQ